MSDQEEKKEKVVTKYDRKMQRRQAEKEKEERNQKIMKGVCGVIVIAIVAFIASFPIRSYMATHETYITVNGEDITRAEYDYNYNNTVNTYINQFGAYLGYMGLDVNSDFSEQEYADGLTWKDNFDEMTVDTLKASKALKADALANGFTYDSSSEVAEFKSSVKDAAKDAGVSSGKYIKQLYGQYATINSVAEYVGERAMLNAYSNYLTEKFTPSDEEIQAYYEEHSEDYETVSYYVSEFYADVDDDDTEEDIESAMSEASSQAMEVAGDLMTNGQYVENAKKSEVDDAIVNWLFYEERREGDETVFPDEENYMYYALRFVSRQTDDAPTANAHIITTQDDGQAILDEWMAGEATEASFVSLWRKYSTNTSMTDGLYKNLSDSGLDAELAAWLLDEPHQAGDTGYITAESTGTNYVVYYVGEGDPSWKADIKNTLSSEAQSDYINALTENATVEDPKGNLNYLKVQAQNAAAQTDVSGDDVSDSDVSGDDALADDGTQEDVPDDEENVSGNGEAQ